MHRTCDTFWSAAWLQGLVRVYDLRSSRPISERDHMILDLHVHFLQFWVSAPAMLQWATDTCGCQCVQYSKIFESNQPDSHIWHASSCFIMLLCISLCKEWLRNLIPFVFTAADRNHLTCSWHLQIRVPSRYQCGIVLANMANPTGTIWNSDCFSMFLSVNCFWLHCAAEINFLHFPATKKGFRWFSSYKMFDDVCAFCSPKHGFPWLQQQQPTGLGSNKWPHGCIRRVAKCNLAACRMKCIERLEILM